MRVGALTPYYQQEFSADDVVAGESTDIVTVYERDGDRLVLTKPNDPELDLDYVASAGWVSDDAINVLGDLRSNNRGYMLFGFETAYDNMPNTGSATYELRAFGTLIVTGAIFDLTGEGR